MPQWKEIDGESSEKYKFDLEQLKHEGYEVADYLTTVSCIYEHHLTES